MNSNPTSINTEAIEIKRIFDIQAKHKSILKKSTASERIAKLNKMKKAIFSMRSEIQDAIYKDFKKPAEEVDLTELFPIVTEIKHIVAHLERWMEPEEVDTPLSMIGSSSYILREPKGTCLVISPWNYPFQLAISPVLMCVATGNTCIVKPSEFTHHTTDIITKYLKTIFDEKEVAVVTGDASVSQELFQLKFDHIHFTGSPAVGKIVMKEASKFLTSVTLELGGKSPAIVDETANMNEASNKIGWGKCINVGQTCIAPDYVLVHESKKTEFVNALKQQIDNAFGKEMSNSKDMGRIVNNRHFTRLKSLLDDAIQKGANVEYGGVSKEDENYFTPTLLTNVSEDSRVLQEEIFGPILPIISYKTIDEALQYINDREKPLALYIFSGKNKNAQYILDNTSAGGTCVNDTLTHIAQPNLPFGGVNNSGIGKSHGVFGFREFSNERAVLKQHLKKGTLQLLYPPYTGFVKRMIDITLKYF
jgi:aldehyde dehydrogenase (NAD+)